MNTAGLKSRGYIIFAICILLVVLATLGAGVSMLVVRSSVGIPDHYRDAAIVDVEAQAIDHIQVNVAKHDDQIMTSRITSYIRQNGGTINNEDSSESYLYVASSVGVRDRVAHLHSKRALLSPGYRYWPSGEAVAPDGDQVSYTVDVDAHPHNRLLLDLGWALTGFAIFLTIMFGVVTFAVVAPLE